MGAFDNMYNHFEKNMGNIGASRGLFREPDPEKLQHLYKDDLEEAEKTKAGQHLKKLKLCKQSATDTLYSVGINKNLQETMSKILKPIGIVWNKTEALQLENKQYN